MSVDLEQVFISQASKQRRKIAIGIINPLKEVVESLERGKNYADLIIVGCEIPGFDCIPTKDDDAASVKLISMLKNKEVDGIVRGQLKDSGTLAEFYKQFDREPIPSNKKIGLIIMKKDDYIFAVGTGSVYNGHTIEDKIDEADQIIEYMETVLGIKPKIAVGGILRPSSVRNKYQMLDDITENSRLLAEYLTRKGYEAKEYYMEYETAVWEKNNLILPSHGIVGNSWVKALIYLGGWKVLCCPYLGLGVVYEDGSRNERDWTPHIIHAVAMANSENNTKE